MRNPTHFHPAPDPPCLSARDRAAEDGWGVRGIAGEVGSTGAILPNMQAMPPAKRVFLLRHAKSAWDDAHVSDHDRPLAPRGRRATGKLARHLERAGASPALVLCSSAKRARETLEGIAPALGPTVSVLVESRLYGATASELLERLRELPETVASVMVVGHNPGIHELAIRLAGGGDKRLRSQLAEKFPTGALATLALDETAWRDLTPGRARLVAYAQPRQLP